MAVTQQKSVVGRKEVKVCNSDLVIFPRGCDLSSEQTFKDYFRKYLVVTTSTHQGHLQQGRARLPEKILI